MQRICGDFYEGNLVICLLGTLNPIELTPGGLPLVFRLIFAYLGIVKRMHAWLTGEKWKRKVKINKTSLGMKLTV